MACFGCHFCLDANINFDRHWHAIPKEPPRDEANFPYGRSKLTADQTPQKPIKKG